MVGVVYALPGGVRMPMTGTIHLPRKGEQVHFLTGEAPRAVYVVSSVTHLILEDEIRVEVVLS